MNHNLTYNNKKAENVTPTLVASLSSMLETITSYNGPVGLPPSNILHLLETNGVEHSLLRVSPACQPKEHRIVVEVL